MTFANELFAAKTTTVINQAAAALFRDDRERFERLLARGRDGFTMDADATTGAVTIKWHLEPLVEVDASWLFDDADDTMPPMVWLPSAPDDASELDSDTEDGQR
ncbi:hypothetical protein GV794_23510 [Nocardia cyriacigeorgica]|uniref:Uncharacterized protein n=1 Tax=Nocardia cyriacigeorgica TaxID=135487 RepID=A0ABX0CQA2_9NOCA|nr:hypothetical protein [Nocardia cyriacigeorgica]NEW58588.1 hypothetical protein [Nocardia cyriacigeorgica]